MDTAHWMEQMGDRVSRKPLNTLVLPGTHDSGSYAITTKSQPTPLASDSLKAAAALQLPAVEAWAKSQSFGLAEQFKRGIRYFDLRIYERSPGEFWLHHSFYSVPLLPELHALRAMVLTPAFAKEIVILDIPLVGGDKVSTAGHAALADILWDHFGGNLPDSRNGTKLAPTTKLVDFWSAECNVIVLYSNVSKNIGPESAWFLWDRDNTITSIWYNKQDYWELREKLLAEMTDPLPPNKLSALQAVLTPDTAMIMKGIVPAQYHSLHDIASDINPKISQMIKDVATGTVKASLPNILKVDYFEVGDIVQTCIESNVYLKDT